MERPLSSSDGEIALKTSDSSLLMSSEGDSNLTSSTSTYSLVLPDDFDISYYESESNLSKIIKIQAFWRKLLVLPHYNLILKLHRKRTRVAREIWNSETTYLEGLMTMYQFFYTPLLKISNEPNSFITPDQVSLLFGNLQQLIDTSKKMNTLLAKVVTSYTPHSKLGHIFIDNAEILKDTFTPYVDPFDEANALFLSLRKDNQRFRDWLGGIEFKQCDLGLESYLIMPIQRITRYGLLLRELIHQTWQDHEDFESLNGALSAVEQVASHVNGHKKKVIMQQKIKAIMGQIMSLPEIVPTEDRLYITEGAVTDLGDMVPVTHYIFLFSDIMIWTQMINKKKFMFRKMNWLKESTAEAGEKVNNFTVITNEWRTTVWTKTKEDQNKWLAYLENENFSPDSEAPQPKRPEVIFLNKQKMVETHLKRAAYTRRNAGSTLKVGDKKRNSKRREASDDLKDVKKASKKDKEKEKEKDKDKDKKKAPRGYATMDPKLLEQHRLLQKNMQKSLKQGSISSSKNGSYRESDITPQLLAELRKTKDMTEQEQAELASKIKNEGHISSPPNFIAESAGKRSTKTRTSSDDPSRISSSINEGPSKPSSASPSKVRISSSKEEPLPSSTSEANKTVVKPRTKTISGYATIHVPPQRSSDLKSADLTSKTKSSASSADQKSDASQRPKTPPLASEDSIASSSASSGPDSPSNSRGSLSRPNRPVPAPAKTALDTAAKRRSTTISGGSSSIE